ncbi:hypothetical protein EG68_07394 [Paragonimus skrjabini miyazakii]|uniref:Uncharacterized protein n=1 Tax=Paragonimus skrjabini miyazakii TaxID=59628 RepID=A0A8S9YM93_9TREM|nr:hypothetical protein EG68_07394 [Paragonimus skrjabini miyazakii]
MLFNLPTLVKEKAFILLKWICVKSKSENSSQILIDPLLENADGSWDVDKFTVLRLSSFDIYASVINNLWRDQYIEGMPLL